MWSQAPVSYDKYSLWGISHWGRKQQQFYGFAVNRESARDVYSKRRIIAVTKPQIIEWHNYKHLDWITVHRDDDKLYKFKESDFKRLRIQDIEDMLLLLNKDKQNRLMRIDELHKFNDNTLNVVRTTLDDHLKGIRMKYLAQTISRRSDKERAAAMIQAINKQLKTRRIMRSLEKLCFQRLFKNVHEKHRHPTAYGRSLIRCRKLPKEAQPHKAGYNRLMRIDELHKFNDNTLNVVRTTLDDHLKGIRMKYLAQTISKRSDKERAAAMIQAINKQLKTRRIMRSLEKFVDGRLYEGDFRMLQWTI
nr:hypothetical protein [Tanacetum cinerariifolium]